VLLTTTLSGSAASADEWTDSYEEGKVALEHGEWDKAIESLQKALALRPEPGHQAMTSGLKMVEYLPHYQLGQAYFYSGDYRSAIESLDRAERAGAVAKTSHRQHFGRLREIIQQLVASSERMTQERSLSSRITTALELIEAGDYAEASAMIEGLKPLSPGDARLAILEQWIRSAQQQADSLASQSRLHAESLAEADRRRDTRQRESRAKLDSGLNHYLLGEYQLALAAFSEVQRHEPDFSTAAAWARKTEAEMRRLDPTFSGTQSEPLQPQVIERIITETAAPVFAIRTPNKSLTEVRSKEARLAGQVADDQGIDYIEFTLNGRPLLDASGRRTIIRPENSLEIQKVSFSADIPLRKGENQIVAIAHDVDSTAHWTSEHLTIIRKPAVHETAFFRMSAVATVLLVIGASLLHKVIKYRIAIVNKYNPYIAGSPIRNEKMLFGREKLLKRIMNTLHNNCLMLYGPRRIGKTSIQHELKRRLDNLNDPDFAYVPVMIDLQGVPEKRFFRTLMEDILEACKPLIEKELSLEFRKNVDTFSGREFSRDLKKLIDYLKSQTDRQLKLVLLMDEVDELNQYSEQVNQRLRSVFMKTFADNLVAVMSGCYIRKNWESEGSPWYNFFQEIEIPPLTREAAIDLIRQPVKGIFKYEPQAIERILEYSGCRPYVIQGFCVNVINRIIESRRRRVTVTDVDAVKDEVLGVTD
jgi:tetratricopeptide (TPR) repeat protein